MLKNMNFLSWDNLSRILSGGVGVGPRVKAWKRFDGYPIPIGHDIVDVLIHK